MKQDLQKLQVKKITADTAQNVLGSEHSRKEKKLIW